MKPTERFFRTGQFLFREGEPSQSLFLITKGTVAIRKMRGSVYVEIARVYSNEVLGEISFFDRQPRSAAAVALTDVEVLEIRFEALDKVYKQVPTYMKTIIASIAERLRKANDTIRRLQRRVVDDRGEDVDEQNNDLNAAEILAATSGLGDSSEQTKAPGNGEGGDKPK